MPAFEGKDVNMYDQMSERSKMAIRALCVSPLQGLIPESDYEAMRETWMVHASLVGDRVAVAVWKELYEIWNLTKDRQKVCDAARRIASNFTDGTGDYDPDTNIIQVN